MQLLCKDHKPGKGGAGGDLHYKSLEEAFLGFKNMIVTLLEE